MPQPVRQDAEPIPPEFDTFTIRQLAEIYGVTESAIRQRCQRNLLPAFRDEAGRWRVRKKDLADQWDVLRTSSHAQASNLEVPVPRKRNPIQKSKPINCEWEGERPCLNQGSVAIPWSSLFSNRTGPPKVCGRHAREYAHACLEGMGMYQKWALGIVMREIAEEVYHDQRRDEEYSG